MEALIRGCSQIMSAAEWGRDCKMLTMAVKGGRGCKANADIGWQRGKRVLAPNDITYKMTKKIPYILVFS